MNKWLISCGLLALSLGAEAAKTERGQLKVSAVIRNNTCELSAASVNIIVNMGTFSGKDFYQPGITGTDSPFTITLEKCGDVAANVSVRFDGTAHPANGELFALDNAAGTTTARNLGIAIIDAERNKPVLPGRETDKYALNGLSTTVRPLSFIARYVSTAFPVTAGRADASVNFTMTYD